MRREGGGMEGGREKKQIKELDCSVMIMMCSCVRGCVHGRAYPGGCCGVGFVVCR